MKQLKISVILFASLPTWMILCEIMLWWLYFMNSGFLGKYFGKILCFVYHSWADLEFGCGLCSVSSVMVTLGVTQIDNVSWIWFSLCLFCRGTCNSTMRWSFLLLEWVFLDSLNFFCLFEPLVYILCLVVCYLACWLLLKAKWKQKRVGSFVVWFIFQKMYLFWTCY